MHRGQLIRRLIASRGYTRYLEIGCQADITFAKIEAEYKVGVDPTQGGTLRMTSDEFFWLAKEPFDLIFIDGDHRHPQVMRDVTNSLRLLAPGGTILMHDCLPPTPQHESPDFCGTAWRVFAKIRERPDLDAVTLDEDFGVGIVQVRRNQSPIALGKPMAQLTYAELTANRAKWMRPLSATQVEEYLNLRPDQG